MKSDNPSRYHQIALLWQRFLSFLGKLANPFRPALVTRRWAASLLLLATVVGLLVFPGKQTAKQQQGDRSSPPRVERQAVAQQSGVPEAPSAQADKQAAALNPMQNTREKMNLPSKRYNLPAASLSVSHSLPALTAAQAQPTSSRQIGLVRPTNLSSQSVGQVFSDSDGSQIRLITLKSLGAVELRVHFADFALAPGEEVYVYGLAADSPVAGPYTDQGPLAAVSGAKGAQEFWSDTIPGDTVIIEHFYPGKASVFSIPELVHNYKAFLSNSADLQPKVLGCHNDANCTADIHNDTVARITFVIGSSSSSCSGTMLNDLAGGEFAPYFSTANHCVNTSTVASTVQALWFYRSTACNSGVAGTGITSPTGATLLNTEQSSDQSLLRILYTVPGNLSYSGWTTAVQALNSTVYSLHHPDGSYLRRSSGPITNTSNGCSASGMTNGYFVDFNSGTIEGGSSGAGLRISNGQLIGVTSCKTCINASCPAACNDNGIYGKFSDFYSDIESYLSFGDYGAAPLAPYSVPHFNYTRSLTASSPPSRVRGAGYYGDSYGNFNGTAGQRVLINVESTAFDTFVYLLGPSQRRLIGSDDDSGSGSNSQLSVVLPETGEYIIHVTSFGTGSTGSFNVSCRVQFLDVPETHPFYTEISKLGAHRITLGCGGGNFCPDGIVSREAMAAFIIRALHTPGYVPPTPGFQRFLDVPPSKQFYAHIEEMAVRGITLGCGGPNYCPTQDVTRMAMAAFIIRALHTPGYLPPTPGSQRFLDVPPSNLFYAHIEEMAVRGITFGCGGPNYCPTQSVTRMAMAAFLVRAFGL